MAPCGGALACVCPDEQAMSTSAWVLRNRRRRFRMSFLEAHTLLERRTSACGGQSNLRLGKRHTYGAMKLHAIDSY